MPHPSSKGNDDEAGPSPVGGGAGGESFDRGKGSGSPSLAPGRGLKYPTFTSRASLSSYASPWSSLDIPGIVRRGAALATFPEPLRPRASQLEICSATASRSQH
jgi:hypothetical protein